MNPAIETRYAIQFDDGSFDVAGPDRDVAYIKRVLKDADGGSKAVRVKISVVEVIGDNRPVGMANVRIAIGDLSRACLALHEVKVEAAGSLYATLLCDDAMRATLTQANITWAFDR